MPIFDDIIAREAVWPVEAAWPRRRADALLDRFRARFPAILYDIYWETRLMNAQAYIGGKGRSVRLYGGLGGHREVGVEGVAFTLAHETGHHLGGPPHHEPTILAVRSGPTRGRRRRACRWCLAKLWRAV